MDRYIYFQETFCHFLSLPFYHRGKENARKEGVHENH